MLSLCGSNVLRAAMYVSSLRKRMLTFSYHDTGDSDVIHAVVWRRKMSRNRLILVGSINVVTVAIKSFPDAVGRLAHVLFSASITVN